MGVDIKWEGLDKLQDNLEKAATLDDITIYDKEVLTTMR